MAEQPSEPNGSSRPALPWILFAVSTAVAVLATTGFVYLLNKRTEGPVEVLHDFYQAAHNGDCEGSYDYFGDALKARTSQDEWCAELGGWDLPASFRVEDVSLEGEIATVEVDGERPLTWNLEHTGRTWRLVALPSR